MKSNYNLAAIMSHQSVQEILTIILIPTIKKGSYSVVNKINHSIFMILVNTLKVVPKSIIYADQNNNLFAQKT